MKPVGVNRLSKSEHMGLSTFSTTFSFVLQVFHEKVREVLVVCRLIYVCTCQLKHLYSLKRMKER